MWYVLTVALQTSIIQKKAMNSCTGYTQFTVNQEHSSTVVSVLAATKQNPNKQTNKNKQTKKPAKSRHKQHTNCMHRTNSTMCQLFEAVTLLVSAPFFLFPKHKLHINSLIQQRKADKIILIRNWAASTRHGFNVDWRSYPFIAKDGYRDGYDDMTWREWEIGSAHMFATINK